MSQDITDTEVCPVNEFDSSEVWAIVGRSNKWFKLKDDTNGLTYNTKDFAVYAESLIKEYGFEAVSLKQTNIQTMWRK